jgi:hypothetical protein
MAMALPVEIRTAGDVRAAAEGRSGLMDVWQDGVGRRLFFLGEGCYEVADASGPIDSGAMVYTVEALVMSVARLPDDAQIRISLNSRGVALLAVGPSGAGADFSLNVVPR